MEAMHCHEHDQELLHIQIAESEDFKIIIEEKNKKINELSDQKEKL